MSTELLPCALCLELAKLCKSHIIPEFMYRTIYDESHRLYALSAIPKGNEIRQKGFWERLLCADCETTLSKYEGYARLVLEGGIVFRGYQNRTYAAAEGIDYTRFKLFQLSVLWKAGIVKRHPFEKVKLGPHGEMLRQMLRTGNPGEPNEYPCVMTAMLRGGSVQPDIIVEPTRVRFAGHFGYRFAFGGFVWLYVVSKHRLSHRQSRILFQDGGPLYVAKAGLDELDFIKELVGRIERRGGWPGNPS